MSLALLACGWAASVRPARAEPLAPDAFTATRLRPLFSLTRRPPPVETVAPAAPPMAPPPPPPPPPNVVLSGIVLGPGGGVAIVRRAQDTSALRVALKGEIDGWTVAAIRAREIVLRRDDRTVTLALPQPPR